MAYKKYQYSMEVFMPRKIFVKLVASVLLLLVLNSCVSTTVMQVNAIEPSGKPINNATVLVNGELIGQTPNASKRVSNFMGVDTEITVSKRGYYTAKTGAVQEVKSANIVLGILFNIFAFLWVSGPKSQQNVVLTPRPAQAR
jgi:hypothetical protein